MNLTGDIANDPLVGIAETPEGLSAINTANCAATVWNRTPVPEFQSWIDALDPEQLPSARVILRPEAVWDTTRHLLEAASTPIGPERDRFVDDIAALGFVFADLTGAKWLRMRLDIVTTNACRKFHIDAVTARLVCTYRGTGTQYGISEDGSVPQRFETVPTGAPIVMRGTLWPQRSAAKLLHRSPPIEGTGETRSVLVFDAVEDPNRSSDGKTVH